MGRKKLTDEEKARRKEEREAKKNVGKDEEVKEESESAGKNVGGEASKEEKKGEKDYPETNIGIDIFSQQ